jgi:hypothetical protein
MKSVILFFIPIVEDVIDDIEFKSYTLRALRSGVKPDENWFHLENFSRHLDRKINEVHLKRKSAHRLLSYLEAKL